MDQDFRDIDKIVFQWSKILSILSFSRNIETPEDD